MVGTEFGNRRRDSENALQQGKEAGFFLPALVGPPGKRLV
jgi:hypothetical protein